MTNNPSFSSKNMSLSVQDIRSDLSISDWSSYFYFADVSSLVSVKSIAPESNKLQVNQSYYFP